MNNNINESFKSKKLSALAKEHGGIKVGRNGGLRDGTYAYYGGNGIDLSKVTDDMLYGEPFEYSWETASNEQRNNSIHFNDGYAIALKPYNLAKNDNIDVPGRKQKPSRYFTGIGDTGDHDKRESPFFKNAKKDVGPQYNGFGISSRAGESQNYREAIKNNKEDLKYFEQHPERDDYKNGINRVNNNINYIKGNAKKLLKKNESKMATKISEKEILNIISEEVEMGLAEYRLKKKIKGMVKEAFESIPSSYDFEETENNKDSESKDTKRKRDAIENLFKKNLAPPMSKEAYNLYNIDVEKGKDSTDMKNARSLFAKKAENAIGDNGHQYEFTPDEVNKIYNDLSSSHLTESQLTKIVAESVKRVLKGILNNK